MAVFVWGVIALASLAAAWLIIRGPIRHLQEDLHAQRARELFRRRREWLEADFLGALGKKSPTERVRWEEAHWHDEVLWARDRQTRRLLALIGVDFHSGPSSSSSLFDDLPDLHFDLHLDADGDAETNAHHATALFEFRKGAWHAEGKRLDEIRPDEAVRRNQRFEQVIMHPRRAL